MDFQYENLGDERFQEFCSILISKEFENAQCYPIGQPDGGRDSVVYSMNTGVKKFIVFQVKFVRNPKISDSHKWLIETLKKEIPKILKLIPKGAQSYYILTNVPGTGHLDVGSKDLLNKYLEENIPIPSICWWREDISTMFQKDLLFKWQFPEIINGQDILNSVLFENLQENRERRESTIRAYLVDQYELDNEVKFRQIDLQNKLLDLFTDVPIKLNKASEKSKVFRKQYPNDRYRHFIRFRDLDESFPMDNDETKRAAGFLLNKLTQKEIPKVLLEGGPGQGKSTISQYVSQVHRSRLLNKKEDVDLIPLNIRNTPLRLPIKIDLRLIAAWVEGKNPYLGGLNEELFKKIWNKSLESFLIGHIFYHSKQEFSTTDFIAISKITPILFVFDGFDEIANLGIRKDVIEFINKGLVRIEENAKSIQVIITSRPSVFSDSLGFAIDLYPHFELTDVTPEFTVEYVTKWIKTNRLDGKAASEIRRLINEKLDMPHLRELAKSPMQLAIFISLLRKKGESLPNKRTALYDSYIELLFDRESEKNGFVRDNRNLIIEIHQYLAWVLHSEAESSNNNGTISLENLVKLLRNYLEKEEHKTDVIKLFDVVKDRVCALASRIQGTFEFEVQPLREYFCAKYLYNTSPYSPAGKEKAGTLPDRFAGISRNFYWQNVVRFFAGCFSKGELSMLIQELKELQIDDNLKNTNYPRILTAQLLSDYVFTQYPKLLKPVVEIILNGIHVGNIINQNEEFPGSDKILIPNDCGRNEIVEACFKELKDFPHNSLELIGIIKNNPLNIVELWKSYLKEFKGDNLTKWVYYAHLLGIIHKIEDEVIVNILNESGDQQLIRIMQILLNGNKTEIIINNEAWKNILLTCVLDNKIVMRSKRSDFNSIEFLNFLLDEIGNPNILIRESRNDLIFKQALISRGRRIIRETDSINFNFAIKDGIDAKIKEFSGSIDNLLNSQISLWKSDHNVWSTTVENARKIFNDHWSFILIANVAAGINTNDERFEQYESLNDSTIDLCRRVRCARMKSGNISYWENQIAMSRDDLFTLLIIFTWATTRAIIALMHSLTKLVSNLDQRQYSKLLSSLLKSGRNFLPGKYNHGPLYEYISSNVVPETIIFLLSTRLEYDQRETFIYDYIHEFEGVLNVYRHYKLDKAMLKFMADPGNKDLLQQIKELYKSSEFYKSSQIRESISKQIKIPLITATIIMSDCKLYPSSLVFLAEKSCRINANINSKEIGQLAKKEKWFSETR